MWKCFTSPKDTLMYQGDTYTVSVHPYLGDEIWGFYVQDTVISFIILSSYIVLP